MHKTVTLAFALAVACASWVVAADGAAAASGITQEKNALLIAIDGAPLLRYRFGEVPFKPYVQELYTPSGINILRDAPADHLHHHALMYAVTVDGIDFWGEQPTAGKEVHQSFAPFANEGRGRARFQEKLAWVDPAKNATMLLETRSIVALRPEGLNATIVSWTSELSVPDGKDAVTLSGSHYQGLGMRFPVSMDAGGEFRNAAGAKGEVFRGEERLAPAAWCAYTAKAGGKEVTVAMFDHPDNARSPATWFMMSAPFAYLSATMALHKEPFKIERGKPLVLTYGVAVWDGRPGDSTIGQTCARWVDRMRRAAAETK